MGSLYEEVHRKDSFSIMHIKYDKEGAHATRSEEVTALEFIDKVHNEFCAALMTRKIQAWA